MLFERLYGKNIGSTIRSAQCVCVVAVVVVVAFGFTGYLIMWSAKALPAQSHMLPPVGGVIMMVVAAAIVALLAWRWRDHTNAIREEVVAALANDAGQDGLFEDVISRWATQRVRFVKPMAAVSIVGLPGAAVTLSVPTLILATAALVGLCMSVFPTKKRAFAFLRNTVAAGVADEAGVDQDLSKAVEVYIREP